MEALANIRPALRVEGFMAPYELQWLAKQAQSCHTIAEIGSWRGRSTRALADNCSGLVFAVDPWLPSDPLRHFTDNQSSDWLYREFCRNTADCRNVVRLRMTSGHAAKAVASVSFDMIFIDGDHSYESVRRDIEAWQPLLTSGGLLCGHDYDTAEGVRQAVDEMLGAVDHPAGFIWAVRP